MPVLRVCALRSRPEPEWDDNEEESEADDDSAMTQLEAFAWETIAAVRLAQCRIAELEAGPLTPADRRDLAFAKRTCERILCVALGDLFAGPVQ